MNEIRNHDRYLDPPDEPTHWECDRCGCIFDGGDLNERGDRWYCDECRAEVEIEEMEGER